MLFSYSNEGGKIARRYINKGNRCMGSLLSSCAQDVTRDISYKLWIKSQSLVDVVPEVRNGCFIPFMKLVTVICFNGVSTLRGGTYISTTSSITSAIEAALKASICLSSA